MGCVDCDAPPGSFNVNISHLHLSSDFDRQAFYGASVTGDTVCLKSYVLSYVTTCTLIDGCHRFGGSSKFVL